MEIDFKEFHEIRYYEEFTRSYDIRYLAELQHTGLDIIKIIKDADKYILKNKVKNQFERWDAQFARKIQKESREANKSEAEKLTAQAVSVQETINNILLDTLEIDDTVDWDTLKDFSDFDVHKPKKPKEPSLIEDTDKPDKSQFQPNLSFIEKIIKPLAKGKLLASEHDHRYAINNWRAACEKVKQQNLEKQKKHQNKVKDYEQWVAGWESEKEKFYQNRENTNGKIDGLKSNYELLDENAVLEYCELVLNNSDYPDVFPKSFELDYSNKTKTIIVEYNLPPFESFPTLKEVKFIATRNELSESHFSQTHIAKLYDETIYKIVLRTIHELYEADQANAIDSIIMNGWVTAINKATGKMETSCITSIQTLKVEFNEIELANIEPKSCFKNLKGVGSSKLSGITAVQPIARINRSDSRFTDSREVVDGLNQDENLALMNWEDFEHLIREIFEKEFSTNGGEVKVTQASRDGGVDAIAFDPDPLRGGKIVIQAKRYSNTVGVAAVRDLYGTVMNEGATKGILVTTSDYGPDAYNFAKGKPLTLLNGSNLLHLLHDHGHKATIDLKEAKRILKES